MQNQFVKKWDTDLIKAAGGGGGKGMKIVEEESKLENLF